MRVSVTERLIVQQLDLGDAQYVLRQLNDESFIRFIVDKQVRNLKSAENYIKNGPIKSYQQHGFGLNIVLLKESKTPIGLCGLVKRDELDYPDLGYAFLPEYWQKGYAYEACKGVLAETKNSNHTELVMGVTLPVNVASNKLLKRLGFEFKCEVIFHDHINNLYQLKL